MDGEDCRRPDGPVGCFQFSNSGPLIFLHYFKQPRHHSDFIKLYLVIPGIYKDNPIQSIKLGRRLQLKAYAKRVKIRRIGRSLYALIPSEVMKELKIEEGEEATIMLDYEQRIVAYDFTKKNNLIRH